MTVLLASNAPIGLNKGKPNRSSDESFAWSRPSDWVTFTTPTSSEEKIIGTVAVWNQTGNYIALNMTITDGTQYNVDWGDGTSENVNSGVTAQKNYVFTDLSSGTLSSRGYRQAVITITPTTAGKTFSAVNLNTRHTTTASSTSISNPWLDIAISAPNATVVQFSYNNGSSGGTRTTTMPFCEQVNVVAHNTTTMANMFRLMTALQSVLLSNTVIVTNMSYMFDSCRSLQSVPLFDTSAVTTMEQMFGSCSSLRKVPLFNTALVTSMELMFSSCSALDSVPLFNTAAVIKMGNMFSSCTGLTSVPFFNTVSASNMTQMFYQCSSLRTVPPFNMAANTTMSSMFLNCYELKTIPAFTNTNLVTTMNQAFSSCFSLESVSLFDTSANTTFNNTFSTCSSLKSVPAFNASACTNFSNMFASCNALQSVPLMTTSNGTDFSFMFNNCISLLTIPSFDLSKATSVRSMINQCTALQNASELGSLYKVSSDSNNNLGFGTGSCVNMGKVTVTGNRWNQNFQNGKMGATELDAMYTALPVMNPAVTNVTSTGTVVTYTVADIRPFAASRTVTMTGITPAAYNLTGVTMTTATPTTGNAGTFTVTNAATGTFVSGGIASLVANTLITVTGNPGVATDNPAIATAKGWTVSG